MSGERSSSSATSVQAFSNSFVGQALRALNEAEGLPGRKQMLGSVRLFAESAGYMTFEEVTKEFAADFAAALARLPSNPKARLATFADRQQTSSDRLAITHYSGKTIQQHIAYLGRVWDIVQGTSLSTARRDNPFKSLDLPKLGPRAHFALNQSQIEKIFAVPVFASRERPGGCSDEACYWIPVLLLWTGARAAEIADLNVEDVIGKSPEDLWLRIRNSGGRRRRIGKPKASCRDAFRVIPIASQLVALGFMDYVEWLKARDHQGLFPHLVSRGATEDRFAGFGLWWGGYLQRLGSYPVGRRPATGFRTHWFVAARRCGLTEEALNYMTCRNERAELDPTTITPKILRSELQKLTFEYYDLKSLTRWTAPPEDRT